MRPFSESTMTLWEGAIRVAAVARWPGGIPAGSHCAQVCATFDLAATAAALAGARGDPAAPFDGIDLMPALRGGATRPRDPFSRLAQRRKQKTLQSGGKAERPEVLAELQRKYTVWEREMLSPIALDSSGEQSRH